MAEELIKEPIHVHDNEFDSKVLQAALPVIVDFWAPWCGPCRMVAPILDKIALDYSGQLIVAKVNTDEDSLNATNYGVQGIPTMLFIHRGKVLHTQVGALPERALRDLVGQFLDVTKTA